MISRIWRQLYNGIDIAIESISSSAISLKALCLGLLSLWLICIIVLTSPLVSWGIVLVSVTLLFLWRRYGSKQTLDNHATWAKQYDQVNELSFGKPYDSLTQATLRLVNRLGASLAIVDFGAGTGRLSLPLAEAKHRVTAVEPSQPMLDELDRKDIANRVTKRRATIAGYQGRGDFDLALAVYTVIAYITDANELRASLKNVESKLKPGGYLIVDIPHKIVFQDRRIINASITRSMRFVEKGDELYEYQEETELSTSGKSVRYSDSIQLRRWTEEQVIDALQVAGFGEIRRVVDGEMNEEDADTFRLSGATYLICRKPTPAQQGNFLKALKLAIFFIFMGIVTWVREHNQVQTPTVVPVENLPADIPRTGIRYKVKSGESLKGIAMRNGSKVEWILKANQINEGSRIRAGAEIFIPQP